MLRPVQFLEELVSLRLLRGHALADIYVAEAIKTFGASMVNVFETIYLFLFFQNHGIAHPASAVFLFFGIFYGAFALLCPIGAELSSRFGFSRMALVSTPFLFCYFLFLLLLPQYPWLIVGALFASIIRAAVFWPGFHLLFVTSSTMARRGSAFGGLTIVNAFASVVGPAIGGVVIMRFGYSTLFILVLPLMLASGLPYFLVKDSGHKISGGLGRIFKRLRESDERNAALAFAAHGAEDESNGRLWPLFLFILAISYSSLGLIVSLGTGLSMITTYFIGKRVDKGERMRLLTLGSALTAAAWLVRAGVRSVLPAAAASIAHGTVKATAQVPLMATFYDRASAAKNPYDAIVFREVMINGGRAVFLATLAAVAVYISDFRVLLIVAATLPLLFPLVKYWRP